MLWNIKHTYIYVYIFIYMYIHIYIYTKYSPCLQGSYMFKPAPPILPESFKSLESWHLSDLMMRPFLPVWGPENWGVLFIHHQEEVCASWRFESWLEICAGSIYHVHFAWQVWHGQLPPRFKFNKLKSFSGVEIDQNHVDKRILGGKGLQYKGQEA